MSIYLYGPNDGAETVELISWSIRQFEGSTERHFVGFCTLNHEGRVSTPIVELDPVGRTGISESGRRYKLVGLAGGHQESEYVWNWFVTAFGDGHTWADVTEQLIPGSRARFGNE